MAGMYTTKRKKKERDPNLPPPENLFSHGKKIRDITANTEQMSATIDQQQAEINMLKAKIRSLSYHIDQLISQTRRR